MNTRIDIESGSDTMTLFSKFSSYTKGNKYTNLKKTVAGRIAPRLRTCYSENYAVFPYTTLQFLRKVLRITLETTWELRNCLQYQKCSMT